MFYDSAAALAEDEAFRDRLTRYAGAMARRGGARIIADDLVQEAYLAILIGWPAKPEHRHHGYLWTIAARTVANRAGVEQTLGIRFAALGEDDDVLVPASRTSERAGEVACQELLEGFGRLEAMLLFARAALHVPQIEAMGALGIRYRRVGADVWKCRRDEAATGVAFRYERGQLRFDSVLHDGASPPIDDSLIFVDGECHVGTNSEGRGFRRPYPAHDRGLRRLPELPAFLGGGDSLGHELRLRTAADCDELVGSGSEEQGGHRQREPCDSARQQRHPSRVSKAHEFSYPGVQRQDTPSTAGLHRCGFVAPGGAAVTHVPREVRSSMMLKTATTATLAISGDFSVMLPPMGEGLTLGSQLIRHIQGIPRDEIAALRPHVLAAPTISGVLARYLDLATDSVLPQFQHPTEAGAVGSVDAPFERGGWGCFGRGCHADWRADGRGCLRNCPFGLSHYLDGQGNVQPKGPTVASQVRRPDGTSYPDERTSYVVEGVGNADLTEWIKSGYNSATPRPVAEWNHGDPQLVGNECIALMLFYQTFDIPPAPSMAYNTAIINGAMEAIDFARRQIAPASPAVPPAPTVIDIDSEIERVFGPDSGVPAGTATAPPAAGPAPVFAGPITHDSVKTLDQLRAWLVDGGFISAQRIDGTIERAGSADDDVIFKKVLQMAKDRRLWDKDNELPLHTSWKSWFLEHYALGSADAFGKKVYSSPGVKDALKDAGSVEALVATLTDGGIPAEVTSPRQEPGKERACPTPLRVDGDVLTALNRIEATLALILELVSAGSSDASTSAVEPSADTSPAPAPVSSPSSTIMPPSPASAGHSAPPPSPSTMVAPAPPPALSPTPHMPPVPGGGVPPAPPAPGGARTPPPPPAM